MTKIKIPRKIIHLDCTLRDGGYYNNWDFNEDLINDYLFAIDQAGLDIAEIGYSFVESEGFKGACAFTTEEFLKSIIIPESLSIGVMINSNDIESKGDLNILTFEKLIHYDSYNSLVDVVRIATCPQKLEVSLKASFLLKKKGYKVGINLAHISELDLYFK